GRCVPAVHIQVVGFIADVFAEVQGQFVVVGLGQHHNAGMVDVLAEGEVAAFINAVVDQAGGGVTVGGGGFVHRLDGGRAVTGLGDQGLVIVGSQLLQQLVPLGIIVGQAAQVDQAQAVFSTVARGIGQ